MEIKRLERNRRSRIRKLMNQKPNPNDQMFWVNHANGYDEFLIKRFETHYNGFLDAVKTELLKGR